MGTLSGKEDFLEGPQGSGNQKRLFQALGLRLPGSFVLQVLSSGCKRKLVWIYTPKIKVPAGPWDHNSSSRLLKLN